MAYISKIALPTGTAYDIKDANAVESVSYSNSTLTVTPRSGTAASYEIESGTTVTVSSTAPSGGTTGDIWLVTEN